MDFWPQNLVEWTQALLLPAVVVSAAVAIFQLRRNVMQSRAAFLLELETKWDRIQDARRLHQQMQDSVRKSVYEAHSGKRDSAQERALCAAYAAYLQALKKENPQSFTGMVEYWGFYETVGLMVRRGYIPFQDAYSLYKGPLVEIDRACREFIKEWQNEAHRPSGLYSNALYLSGKARRRCRAEELIDSLKFWKGWGKGD